MLIIGRLDWRKMSASYNNQNQKGGVSSAPFANDYTWDKEKILKRKEKRGLMWVCEKFLN